MKITIIALFTCIYTLFAVEANSQNTKVSIHANGFSVQEVIREIEKQTDYLFVYDKNEVNMNRKVSLNAKDEPVSEVLNRIFEDTNITYKLVGKNITLINEGNILRNTENQQIPRKINGIVLDHNDEPIIGANVVEKGTTNGTITDMDGKYTLSVAEGTILLVTYIGYNPQEIKVGKESDIRVVLREDTQALDEVVIVGYGTQKKVNLTGAVEAIEGDKLQNRAVTNVSQALQGQVSGVNFTAGDYGFEPGADLDFQIRGQGSAYVLIDGVEGDMNRLNPNDIESVSVLKDAAAAAIYGARAPYGVVLITTKSGGKETKPQVSVSANVSIAKPHRMPSMVDSYTFARAMNEAGTNGGGLVYTNETIDRIIAYQNDPSLPETVPSSTNPNVWENVKGANANYDWFEEYYGTGLRNQENISIRGGGKTTAYFVSAGHVYDDGILNYGTDTYRRFNINSKLDVDLTPWWKFTTNTRFEVANREKPNYDNQGDYELLFHQIARTYPTQAKWTPNGVHPGQSKIPWTEDAGTDKTIDNVLTQRFAMVFTPIKGWTINADYSIRLNAQKFTSENFTAYEDMVDGTMVPLATTLPSYVAKRQRNNFYQSTNMYTSYDFSLADKHNFTVMGGVQYETQRNESLWGRKNDLISPSVPSISTSTGDIQLEDEMEHWATAGAFFRVGYNYKEKYLFEANGRYDGTSKFAEGNRWGFFPSFSAGWNVAREDFWEKWSGKVNTFKIRASWGQLGNQNVDAYQDLALLGIKTQLKWLIDGQRPVYTEVPPLINRSLTWETSQTLDIGFDLGALNNRLIINADWYQRLTKNQLGPARALPGVIGADLPNENNSTMKTNGWEINISWRDRLECGLGYSVTAMLFDYQSEITKYNNPTKILTTNYEGMKVGEIWGFETAGLIQTDEEAQQIMDSKSQHFFYPTWRTGDVKYVDRDRSGVIDKGKNTLDDHGDLKVIGNMTPRYQFGLTLGADYKNFDLSVFFQGVAKRDLWLTGNMFWGFDTWAQCSISPEHLDYYRDVESEKYVGLGMNTNAYFPRPYLSNEKDKNYQAQSRYLQNGAYLRLKNLQFGYSLPKNITEKIKMEKVRFFFTGENLFTLTGRFPKGMDPETAKKLTDSKARGDSKSHFAQSVFAFGIDLQF